MMILLFRVSFLPNPPPLRFMYKSNTISSSSRAYYDMSLTFSKHKMEINEVIASYLLLCTDVRKKKVALGLFWYMICLCNNVKTYIYCT